MAETATESAGSDNGAIHDGSTESIDQVRDLLFGSQLRTVNTRIQNLDERLRQEATAIRSELQALGAQIRDSLDSMGRQHQNFEAAAGQADAELRDHLMKQGAALTSNLDSASQRISTELDRIHKGLRTDKLDVQALVAGLTDLATRLGDSVKKQ
jgi:F0F1-type ATP synthase membrane subunit b/b'